MTDDPMSKLHMCMFDFNLSLFLSSLAVARRSSVYLADNGVSC